MTTNFRGGVFSSHKLHRRLPEASETPKHQKNSPIYLELSIPLNFEKTYLCQDQISPEPPGTQKQPLVRPLGSLEVTNYMLNNYNYKKKKKSLLPLEPINYAEKEEKYWILYMEKKEKAQKSRKFKALREADEEFRQKPGLILQVPNKKEIPRVDRNRFEYITKNFSESVNYNLSRWLEFREKINTIQNFDIMKFTQSYETINIDDQSRVQRRVLGNIPFTTKCMKIIRKTKSIYNMITDKKRNMVI
jgi:hypothetical protein